MASQVFGFPVVEMDITELVFLRVWLSGMPGSLGLLRWKSLRVESVSQIPHCSHLPSSGGGGWAPVDDEDW